MIKEPQSNSFLDWYVYMQGVSEIPTIYHRWCGISLLAAVCTDRIWYEHFTNVKLFPNLFVFLLGPSGIGKDVAIAKIVELVGTRTEKDEAVLDKLGEQLYYGRATIQYLMDRMSRPSNRKDRPSALYLLTPELTSSISAGPQAQEFIRIMTDLYTFQGERWQEGTRTRGGITIEKPNVNWIGASTMQWLIDAIPRTALEGGWLGRVALAEADYDFSRRIPNPWTPADREDIRRWLALRLAEMMEVSGQFSMSQEAWAINDDWYRNRPEPSDLSLAAAWQRQPALCLKLSMILSLAEGLTGTIEATHLIAAQRLVEESYRSLPRLSTAISSSPESRGVTLAEERIKRGGSGGVTRTALLKYLHHFGYTAFKLEREILPTLLGKGRVIEERGAKGATIYKARLISMGDHDGEAIHYEGGSGLFENEPEHVGEVALGR